MSRSPGLSPFPHFHTRLLGVCARSLLASLALAAAFARGATVAPPSIEDFFARAEILSAAISPDGKQIALVHRQPSGEEGLAVMDADTGTVEPLVTFPSDEVATHIIHWKGNHYLIYQVIGDIARMGVSWWGKAARLRGYDLEKHEVVDAYFTRLDSRVHNNYEIRDNPWVLDWLEDRPDEVLVWDAAGQEVYRLDIRTKEKKFVAAIQDQPFAKLNVDVATGVQWRERMEKGLIVIELRRSDKADWIKVDSAAPADVLYPATTPSTYAGSTAGICYAFRRPPTGPTSLVTFDPASGAFGPSLHDFVHDDAIMLLCSPGGHRFYGIEDGWTYHWFDPERARLQAMIDSALPGTFNRVEYSSTDETRLIISATSDRSPQAWLFLDRTNKRMKVLFQHRLPGLQPRNEVSFTARDGLAIRAILTLPAKGSPGPVPLVVLVHDGTFGYSVTPAYDADAEFLVSRGYAVLEPNPRGSGGSGRGFIEQGRGQWGRKIQDDIEDGAHWAVKEGITRDGQIAIYGTGLGGYAALLGAAKTPDLFRCVISRGGYADFGLLDQRREIIKSDSEPLTYFFRDWMGIDDTAGRDPVAMTDKMKAPILAFYDSEDFPIDPRQWSELSSALDRSHVPYEFIGPEHLKHTYQGNAYRLPFYHAMEAFLAKYLPVATADQATR